MDLRPGNPLPSPKGPRFHIVESWPIYGPRDEVQAIRRRVVATAYTYPFAEWLIARMWDGGGDVYLDLRDLRPDPVPDLVPAPPHQDSCLCAACQELPF